MNHHISASRSSLSQPIAVPSGPVDPIYAQGDTVMHPSEGLCTIAEVRPMRFGSNGERLYYILRPSMEKSSSTVYMPVDRGNVILRRLFCEKDIDELIAKSADYAGLWVEDSKQRRDAFSHILTEGNYAKLIRMIKELHEYGAHRTAEGKKPCAADEAILDEAERLLHQEFSYVLHLSIDDTANYVKTRLISAC